MTFKTLVHQSSGLITAALILSLLAAMATLAQPLLVGKLIESIGTAAVVHPTIMLVTLIIGEAILLGVQMYLTAIAADRAILTIRQKLTHHLLRLPLQAYDKEGAGAFVTRLTSDTSVIGTAFSSALVESVGGVIVVIGAITYMAYLDTILFSIVILILVLSLLIITVATTKISRLSVDVQDNLSHIGSLLQASISAMKTVKSSTAERLITVELNKRISTTYTAGKTMSRIESILTPISTVTVYISLVAVLIFGAVRLDNGNITASELIAFITALFLIVNPIAHIAEAIASFRQASGAFARIRTVLNTPLEADLDTTTNTTTAGTPNASTEHDLHITTNQTNSVVPRNSPTTVSANTDITHTPALPVRFESVTLSYNDHHVLTNVSFELHAGEKVAIVGPSGSGKTTLLSLPLRFYTPDSGRVIVGDQQVSEWNLARLRTYVSYIEQEPMLLPGTLRTNLTLGHDHDVPDSTLAGLLRHVGLPAFANKDGLDTVIASSGAGVSGGERQRIAIARAIIRNAPLIIVDEPTSALDAASGSTAVDYLLSTPATVLLCTHDMTMATRAGRIITLTNGRITENHNHMAH